MYQAYDIWIKKKHIISLVLKKLDSFLALSWSWLELWLRFSYLFFLTIFFLILIIWLMTSTDACTVFGYISCLIEELVLKSSIISPYIVQLEPHTNKTTIKFLNSASLAASLSVSFSILIYFVVILMNKSKKCYPSWLLGILISSLNLSK